MCLMERTAAIMNDAISRAAALDVVEKMYKMCEGNLSDCHDLLVACFTDLPSAQRWIPCSERLPGDDEEVIVSCTDDSGDYSLDYTTVGWHYKGLWVVNNERSYFVRAWMPLPSPWKGEPHD